MSKNQHAVALGRQRTVMNLLFINISSGELKKSSNSFA